MENNPIMPSSTIFLNPISHANNKHCLAATIWPWIISAFPCLKFAVASSHHHSNANSIQISGNGCLCGLLSWMSLWNLVCHVRSSGKGPMVFLATQHSLPGKYCAPPPLVSQSPPSAPARSLQRTCPPTTFQGCLGWRSLFRLLVKHS